MTVSPLTELQQSCNRAATELQLAAGGRRQCRSGAHTKLQGAYTSTLRPHTSSLRPHALELKLTMRTGGGGGVGRRRSGAHVLPRDGSVPGTRIRWRVQMRDGWREDSARGVVVRSLASVYLLYFTSTNTDARGGECERC